MPRAFAALVILCALPAFAHENPTDWIGQERRTNAKNELCCGAGVDCFAMLPNTIRMTPTGYQLPTGEIIPFNKAAPSADKFFWSCEWGGERKCFFAPIGGS